MDNLYFNPKKLREIANKRSCKTRRIIGWILTAMGGLSMLNGLEALVGHGSITDVVDGLIFLVPGIILIWTAMRRVKRWDQYEALIDNRGNTSISMLAEKMKLPEKTVYADLHGMIGNDFFIGPNYDIEARIDADRGLLVMSVAGKPIKPVPETTGSQGKEEGSSAGAQPSEANWHDEEIPEAEWNQEPVIKVKMTDLDMIRKVIAETPDEDVRNSLYGIEGSLRRIDSRVQSDPKLKNTGSIRNLYRYYLPQIMELIDRYQEQDGGSEIREQITRALNTSAEALGNIEADLLEKEQMDIEVDIRVLENMFAQDGLLRKETGPFAAKADGNDKGRMPQTADKQEQRVQTNASQ